MSEQTQAFIAYQQDDWREPLERAAAELRRLAAEVDAAKREAAEHFIRAREWAERCGGVQAEVEALRADAERYRWLRGNCECMGANADAAIDAAKAGAA